MCGICVSVSFPHPDNISCSLYQNFTYKDLKVHLQKRGPDHFEEFSSVYKDSLNIFLCSSVLHLRGSTITKQPFTDGKGNCFLWNGEIFGGSLVESNTESDTKILAEALFKDNSASNVLQVLSSVEGPYSFIFYQVNGLLWFGRDIFGRRSLLWNSENLVFSLCSVSCGNAKWEEVPTAGIFCLDLNLSIAEKKFVIHQYHWLSSASGNIFKENELNGDFVAADIIKKINSTVQVPISNSLNITTLIDSVYLNFITDLQRLELKEQDILQRILNIPVLLETVNNFEIILSEAVRKRVQNNISSCKKCYLKRTFQTNICDHAIVGILFSGGLDSAVIAHLANRHLQKNKPIDLINVAFGNMTYPEKLLNSSSFETPDRITGKNSLKEIETISSSRKWNFIEVNISKDELALKRKECISNLLQPSCTVLDDSIGCALWFAARGKGHINNQDEYIQYASPVRVLLVGMGADEQLAGYSRHRAKFNDGGWSGLIRELSLELDRIGSRNLGRDDRIIADNGVESRYPFLDENVVSFLNSLPVWLKANLNFPRGVGEKLLLRLLAFKMGLTEVSVLPKRAIQFGSRIAKIENRKEKGSDVCERLTV